MATKLQKKKWPNMFYMFDVDHDGKVDRDDLLYFNKGIAHMRGMKEGTAEYNELQNKTMKMWEGIHQVADLDNDEAINLDEWLTFWTTVTQNKDLYKSVIFPISQFIFGVLDEDDDGRVMIEEYRRLCSVMRLGPQYADKMFAKLDLNQDGSISKDELFTLAEQFFMSDDPNAPGNHFFGPVNLN